MEGAKICILLPIIMTYYSADGASVPLRQTSNLAAVSSTSTNTSWINGMSTFVDTLTQELQLARGEIRALRSELNAVQGNMLVRITQAEAGLDAAKINAIKCAANNYTSRPVPVGVLKPGESLYVNEKFCSQNGGTCLYIQGNGNMVLYEMLTYRAVWSANPAKTACNLDLNLLANGRLELNIIAVGAIWVVQGEPGMELAFQSDGHLCMKYPASAKKGEDCKWSTRPGEKTQATYPFA